MDVPTKETAFDDSTKFKMTILETKDSNSK